MARSARGEGPNGLSLCDRRMIELGVSVMARDYTRFAAIRSQRSAGGSEEFERRMGVEPLITERGETAVSAQLSKG